MYFSLLLVPSRRFLSILRFKIQNLSSESTISGQVGVFQLGGLSVNSPKFCVIIVIQRKLLQTSLI